MSEAKVTKGCAEKVRAGEVAKPHYRSERFFNSASDWFIATREQHFLGPFPSRPDAEIELVGYLYTVMNDKRSGGGSTH